MKQRILVLLLSLLSFAAANNSAFANVGSTSSKQAVAAVSEERGSPDSGQLTALHSLMNSVVKVNENDHPVFRGAHQLKRSFLKQFASHSPEAQKAWYFFYSRSRNNSIHSSPFYIAYHRLTI
ncbi:MAG: hypothetical protein ACJ77K_14580 [Bacteroidia bacterium]